MRIPAIPNMVENHDSCPIQTSNWQLSGIISTNNLLRYDAENHQNSTFANSCGWVLATIKLRVQPAIASSMELSCKNNGPVVLWCGSPVCHWLKLFTHKISETKQAAKG
jgi:uncharacterized membrane protein